MPKDTSSRKLKTSTNKITVMQNKRLHTVARAFKTTPIPTLETETYITPINIHLDQLQKKARHQLRTGGQAKVISAPCKAIVAKLQGNAGRKRVQQPTPSVQKQHWANFLNPSRHGLLKPGSSSYCS